ncbi:MAG TPA: alginate export family protein [Terracidiphilus sp.]|nr:alginate export family protein [Terracidiphilus sp.]
MRATKECACALLIACSGLWALGQQDPIVKGATALHDASGNTLSVHVEERTRWEERYGVSFGKAVNQQDMLSRVRIGMAYKATPWLTISGMGQDARAPFYGPDAPSSLRESMDLQEAWVGLGAQSSPFNLSFGRRMINYGETRIIGVPQWSNTSRTYDYGRAEFANTHMTVDALMVSPVVILSDSFNNPELGNRYWGTYDMFPRVWRGLSIDTYALRHSQNAIGGWTGNGTLGTNSYGARFYGPLPAHFGYSLEGIAQNGHMGPQNQRAFAWYAAATRTSHVYNMPLNVLVEYKGASGSHSGEDHSSTFDQLTPANHDKFGHMDLFGWRNLKTFKNLDTLNITKSLAFNVMYTDENLFSASDALYNSSGSKYSISTKGAAGTRVGQELDSFATFTIGHHTFLAGFGHFFKGQFVQATTPGINPRYFYIAQEYTIK